GLLGQSDAEGRRRRFEARGRRTQGRQYRLRRNVPGAHRYQGAVEGYGHAAEGQGDAAEGARRRLRRRVEPDVEFAALAVAPWGQAYVPRSRPAWRRALLVAGGHEGCGHQVSR